MYGPNDFTNTIKCFQVNAPRCFFITTLKLIGLRAISIWELWYVLGPLSSHVMLVALTFTLLVCAHIEIQSNIVVIFLQGIKCNASTKIFMAEKSYFMMVNKSATIITLQKAARYAHNCTTCKSNGHAKFQCPQNLKMMIEHKQKPTTSQQKLSTTQWLNEPLTNINVDRLRFELSSYLDKSFVEYFYSSLEHGFDTLVADLN